MQQMVGAKPDDALVREIVARFAPPRLGLKLDEGELLDAARTGLREAIASGISPRNAAALAARMEMAIRREIPSKHSGLVKKVALGYRSRGLDLDDLIQEGRIGLITAAERFSTDNGARFSTYASWWIKHDIRTAIRNEADPVRLPIYLYGMMSRVRKDPSHRDRLTGAKKEFLDRALQIKGASIIRDGDDGHRSWIEDHVAARVEDTPVSVAPGIIESILRSIPDPDVRRMVVERYGLGGLEPMFHREIAARRGLGKSTVVDRLKQAQQDMAEAVERRGLSYEDCLAG